MSACLTGKVACLVSEIRKSIHDEYDDVKAKLLKAARYMERGAGLNSSLLEQKLVGCQQTNFYTEGGSFLGDCLQ